ncbi:hypothetical protein [Nonomuraea rhizosphaerae]|uniref:hypothetical protein n=1 Tax=Nonomuraea rhizosphaerae TaxID=2665663 RepID=UPI001C5DEC5E|nr:hypothetical protein [Nonomuraea rhizosphaerae]
MSERDILVTVLPELVFLDDDSPSVEIEVIVEGRGAAIEGTIVAPDEETATVLELKTWEKGESTIGTASHRFQRKDPTGWWEVRLTVDDVEIEESVRVWWNTPPGKVEFERFAISSPEVVAGKAVQVEGILTMAGTPLGGHPVLIAVHTPDMDEPEYLEITKTAWRTGKFNIDVYPDQSCEIYAELHMPDGMTSAPLFLSVLGAGSVFTLKCPKKVNGSYLHEGTVPGGGSGHLTLYYDHPAGTQNKAIPVYKNGKKYTTDVIGGKYTAKTQTYNGKHCWKARYITSGGALHKAPWIGPCP